MSAPAGPCEWCGGPQWWTTVLGEIYVACKNGCLPLPWAEEVPPLFPVRTAGALVRIGEMGVDIEGGEGYLPHEGSEAEARRNTNKMVSSPLAVEV